jgi:hypothetical protein
MAVDVNHYKEDIGRPGGEQCHQILGKYLRLRALLWSLTASKKVNHSNIIFMCHLRCFRVEFSPRTTVVAPASPEMPRAMKRSWHNFSPALGLQVQAIC